MSPVLLEELLLGQKRADDIMRCIVVPRLIVSFAAQAVNSIIYSPLRRISAVGVFHARVSVVWLGRQPRGCECLTLHAICTAWLGRWIWVAGVTPDGVVA